MNKNKILIPVFLSTGIMITLKISEINIPLIFYISIPLIVSILSIKIYKIWIKQSSRNIFISLIKQLNYNIRHIKKTRIITSLILTTLAFLFYDKYLDIWRYADKNILPELKTSCYLYVIPVSYIMSLVYSISINFLNVKSMQDKSIDLIPGLEIIEVENDSITIISTKTIIEQRHKNLLEVITNNKIAHIKQDKYVLSKYHLELGNSEYRQLEKGSIARLEQILINLKDKPQHVETVENDIEIIHKYLTILPIKKIQRQLSDIEHKLGLNTNMLTLDVKNGYVYFKIKKNINKIYILDDVIGNIKKTEDELSFVLGVNESSGSIIIENLLKLKHLLIAGKTGSGKSCTFKCIIESLMYLNNNIVWYMLDFADSALVRYEDFNNVKYIENEIENITDSLKEIIREYQDRKQLLRENHFENIQEYNSKFDVKLPYIIVAIDEANAFKSEMDNKEFTPLEKIIKIILQRGRKYGIFCIMAVQQTNDRDFVKSWKTQFTRIAHLLEDTIDCVNITTKKEYYELIPKLNTGEFYVLSEFDNYKLKGFLTNNDHNELYKNLKKGYTTNDNIDEIKRCNKEIL